MVGKETTLDPRQHPDLRRIGRELRKQMDETLDAELHAARAAARRRRTLRDVLLAAEDRRDMVAIGAVDGRQYHGSVAAVGADHIELDDRSTRRVLALDHLVAVEIR